MDVYVFYLKEPASRAFQGVVAIFATKPQEVWRRFAPDENAHRIPSSIARADLGPLNAELKALVDGTTIQRDSPLLWRLFDDPVVSAACLVTFIGQYTFTALSHSESTFKGHVTLC